MIITKDKDGISISLENFKEEYMYRKFTDCDTMRFVVKNQYQNSLTLYHIINACFSRLFDNIGKYYDVGKWGITDGYWLTFLSPVIIIYWILLSVILIPIILLLLAIGCFSLIWLALFEAPSDVMNKKKIDILVENYNKSDTKNPIDLLLRDYDRQYNQWQQDKREAIKLAKAKRKETRQNNNNDNKSNKENEQT